MSLFTKSLNDLVKGIRAHKNNEVQYIEHCIGEIKNELRNPKPVEKAQAIQKLTYLQMLGYDMSWASFHIVEVMSQPKFLLKRIGYLAACQAFDEDNDFIILVTQLLKRDFQSKNQYEAGLAINCMANICNTELGRNLVADIVGMLNSSNDYLRKKAVLALYKILLKVPSALRPAYPRLREKLQDADSAVQCAAVTVFCELCYKNPKNTLALCPVLFDLLQRTSNTWMQIKIMKMFGQLCMIEPRLARKLVEPLTNLINTTHAKSLQYECINVVVKGCTSNLPLVRLCVDKLREFVEDQDQNLKYLGLLGLSNIMKSHPRAVLEHRHLVISCLEDADVSIRLRALDLLTGMVTRRNATEIVRHLFGTLASSEGVFRQAIAEKIVTCTSLENYKAVADFEWYLATLLRLSTCQNIGRRAHGLIAATLLDVMLRVRAVRPYGIRAMSEHMQDLDTGSVDLHAAPATEDTHGKTEESAETQPPLTAGTTADTLSACAFCLGEYAGLIEPGEAPTTLALLLHGKWARLPSFVHAVFLQAVLKLAVRHPAVIPEPTEEERALPAPVASHAASPTAASALPEVAAAASAPAASADDLLGGMLGDFAPSVPAPAHTPVASPSEVASNSASSADLLAGLGASQGTPAAEAAVEAGADADAGAGAEAAEDDESVSVSTSVSSREDEKDEEALYAPLTRTQLIDTLTVFAQSIHAEVAERTCLLLTVLSPHAPCTLADLLPLFEEDIKPVPAGIQKKVPLPEGLDLDAEIYPPEEESVLDEGASMHSFTGFDQATPDDLQSIQHDLQEKRRRNQLFYLDDNATPPIQHLGPHELSASENEEEGSRHGRRRHRHGKRHGKHSKGGAAPRPEDALAEALGRRPRQSPQPREKVFVVEDADEVPTFDAAPEVTEDPFHDPDDNLATIDITAGGDEEELPQVATYSSPAEAMAPKVTAQPASAARVLEQGPPPAGGREHRHRGHKHRGHGHGHKHRHRHREDRAAPAPAAPAPAPALSLEPVRPRTAAPVAPAPVPLPAPVLAAPPASAPAAPAKENREKRHHRHRHGHGHGHGHKHRSRGEATSATAATPAAANASDELLQFFAQ